VTEQSPLSHWQLPPVLRYRLRAKPGDRPSSLAHTGEPLLESESDPQDDAGRPGPPDGETAHPVGMHAPECAGGGPGGEVAGDGGRPSWVKRFPSDFVYRQNLVRGAEPRAAARPGSQAAPHSRTALLASLAAALQASGAAAAAAPSCRPAGRSMVPVPPPPTPLLQPPPHPAAELSAAAPASSTGPRGPPDAPFRLGRALLLPPTAASWGDGEAAGGAGDGGGRGPEDGGGRPWLLPGGTLADLAVPGPA
jgi:hypothetical protein